MNARGLTPFGMKVLKELGLSLPRKSRRKRAPLELYYPKAKVDLVQVPLVSDRLSPREAAVFLALVLVAQERLVKDTLIITPGIRKGIMQYTGLYKEKISESLTGLARQTWYVLKPIPRKGRKRRCFLFYWCDLLRDVETIWVEREAVLSFLKVPRRGITKRKKFNEVFKSYITVGNFFDRPVWDKVSFQAFDFGNI